MFHCSNWSEQFVQLCVLKNLHRNLSKLVQKHFSLVAVLHTHTVKNVPNYEQKVFSFGEISTSPQVNILHLFS